MKSVYLLVLLIVTVSGRLVPSRKVHGSTSQQVPCIPIPSAGNECCPKGYRIDNNFECRKIATRIIEHKRKHKLKPKQYN